MPAGSCHRLMTWYPVSGGRQLVLSTDMSCPPATLKKNTQTALSRDLLTASPVYARSLVLFMLHKFERWISKALANIWVTWRTRNTIEPARDISSVGRIREFHAVEGSTDTYFQSAV